MKIKILILVMILALSCKTQKNITEPQKKQNTEKTTGQKKDEAKVILCFVGFATLNFIMFQHIRRR